MIYAFLTGEMGLNRAAAMGVMANIRYESSYNPQCSGDSGTSYGICQWHLGRKTNLINYCNQNNLDYHSLEGQLRFLQYELSASFPAERSHLQTTGMPSSLTVSISFATVAGLASVSSEQPGKAAA